MTGDLREVFDRYDKATAEELWVDSDEVKRYVLQPQVVERYLSGEFGYNILHSFRLVVQTRFVAALTGFAGSTVEKLLREAGKDSRKNLGFVRDALAFDTHRIMNISADIDSTPELALRYDVPAFLEDAEPGPLKSYALPEPRTLRFVLSDEQRAALARSIRQEGEDKLAGVGNAIVSNHIGRAKSALLLRTPAS
jgi:hypothetical protein